ncbi:hypothetical protein LTR97_011470 [Elasticomyces elasticus]|uniref:Uncharacterized protein n=1 Tax=Elasticomyces elasticus TaxID=574655 RepID=A0AAN7VLE1_9PEZI|nr:hypothetical protein LTR97_011470 [Elasticomyces elasticus]
MTRPQYNGGLAPATHEDQIRNDYLGAIKSTTAKNVKVDTSDLLDLLMHQQQIMQNLMSLDKVRRSSRTKENPEQKALATCKSCMSVMHEFLCQTMGYNPLDNQPSDRSSAVAEEVFRIPELAELVLMELTPASILQAMSTYKFFASLITSPKIQTTLGLRSQVTGHWYSPFEIKDNMIESLWRSYRNPELHDVLKVRIGTIKEEAQQIVDTGMVTIYAAFQDQKGSDGMTKAPLATIGECGMSMLICQPSIAEMNVYLSCCGPGGRGGRLWARIRLAGPQKVAGKIRNANGLTVGDLHRATARYQKQHEMCPHARKTQHDRQGWVLTEVSFEGVLQLAKDDPLVLQGRKIIAELEDELDLEVPSDSDESHIPDDWVDKYSDYKRTEGPTAKIDQYLVYKDKANARGDKIVSMADYYG